MIYTNKYYPDVVLTSSAEVTSRQIADPDPRNYFWVLSDLSVESNVSDTNDYNNLNNTPELITNLSVGAVEFPLPELIRYTDAIEVPSCRVALRDNPNHQGLIKEYDVFTKTFQIDRSGSNNYVYAYYNNGIAEYGITSDLHSITGSDSIVLYNVWNVSGEIHAIGYDNKGDGLANKIDSSIMETSPYRVAIHSSLSLSESPTRIINITGASVFAGTVEIDVLPYSSSTDKFTKIYHVAGEWTFNQSIPGGSYDNLYYDNGTNLVLANSNKFIVKWIYRTIGDDKEVFIVYGTNEYSNIEHAKLEQVPVVPSIVNYHGYLVGRIIVQSGANTGLVENVGTSVFIPSAVTFHNDLQGIQGGAVDDYQHVTTTEKNNWNDYPNRTQNYLGTYRNPATLAYEGSLTYSDTTRTVALTANTTIYPKNLKGVPQTVLAGNICTHPNVTDTYFIYYDANGLIQCTTTPWNILTDVSIALVYYNAAQARGICFEERHSYDRNLEAHKQQHLAIGTFCNPCPQIAGYVLAPASPTNSDNTYSLTGYNTYDEDIKVVTDSIAEITAKRVLYRGTAGSWVIDYSNAYGFVYAVGSYIQYNQLVGSDWQLTEVPGNNFVNYYVFATTSIDTANRVLVTPSQHYYSTLAEATAESPTTAQDFNALPLQEWVLLYKITYKTSAAYGTVGKCRIENIEVYEESRSTVSLSGSGITQAFADATYLRLDGYFPAIQVTPTKYLQTVPSDTWIINHNMDRYPSVAIRISTTGYTGYRLEPTIEYPDESTMILRFSQEFTGAAHLT